MGTQPLHKYDATAFVLTTAALLAYAFLTPFPLQAAKRMAATPDIVLIIITGLILLYATGLAAYTAAIRRQKSRFQKGFMLGFIIGADFLVGYLSAVSAMAAASDSGAVPSISVVVNFVSALILFGSVLLGKFSLADISDEEQNPLESLIGAALILLLFIIGRGYGVNGGTLLSIALSYVMIVHILLKHLYERARRLRTQSAAKPI